MRKGLFQVSLIIGLIFGLSAGVSGSSKIFKIESYIPERFVDFEWYIEGDAQADGSNRDDSRYYPDPYRNTMLSAEKSNIMFNFLSNSRYRHFTPNHTLELNFSIDNQLMTRTDSTSDSSRGNGNPFPHVAQTYKLVEQHGGEVVLRLSTDISQYLFSNFFFRCSPGYQFNYSEGLSNLTEGRHITKVVADSGYSNQTKGTSSREDSNIIRQHTLSSDFSIGWGRVYNGEYAVTSLNIIEELDRKGLISNIPDFAEMVQLTEIVFDYRQRHSNDSRIQKMQALDSIISYLTNNEIITPNEKASTIALEDIWDFYPRDERLFGWVFELGATGQYYWLTRMSSLSNQSNTEYSTLFGDSTIVDTAISYSNRTLSSSKLDTDTGFGHFFGIIEYHQPLSVRWQLDALTDVGYYQGKSEHQSSLGTIEYCRRDWLLTIDPRFKYYYDSRSSVVIGAQWRHQWHRGKTYQHYSDGSPTQKISTAKQRTHQLQLHATIEYRIAIPTTLFLGARHTWSRRSEGTSSTHELKYRSYFLSIGLKHWLY